MESKALAGFTLGINFYQIECKFFYSAFCLLLECFPVGRTQFVKCRLMPFLAGIAADAVQGMYADQQKVIILIHYSYHFLHVAVHINFVEPCKAAHTVVYMGYIVSWFQ